MNNLFGFGIEPKVSKDNMPAYIRCKRTYRRACTIYRRLDRRIDTHYRFMRRWKDLDRWEAKLNKLKHLRDLAETSRGKYRTQLQKLNPNEFVTEDIANLGMGACAGLAIACMIGTLVK